MLNVTVPLPDEILADLRDIAAERRTTVEQLLVRSVEFYCRSVQRALAVKLPKDPATDGKHQSLEEDVAKARARLANLSPADREISPRLQTLVGILPADLDAKKVYHDYIERKYL